MPSDQCRHSEHAHAVTEFFLTDYGYCGGVVPANEVIRTFLAVDGGCHRYLMAASVVRGLEGDKLPRPAELRELLIPELGRPVEILRWSFFPFCPPQGFGQKPWGEPSGFLAVEINSGHPAGDLAALPPDVTTATDPLLYVLKRKRSPLPLAVYRVLSPVAQAHKLYALVVVEAEEISVSFGSATHRCAPGVLRVSLSYILL